MIWRLLAQLILTSSLLQIYPADLSLVENFATLPAAADRPAAMETYDAWTLLSRQLPAARDWARTPVKVETNSLGVVTSAVSAVVIDRGTGAVLFEKNATETRSIGSLVKLMTALVFLEGDPDLNQTVTLEAEDLRAGGIQYIALNDPLSLRDLLFTSLVGSDNSATAALVRLSKMSLGDFVARMNEKAAEIGLVQTTFVDATGLSEDNRSLAPDVAKLVSAAMDNEIIRTATETSEEIFRSASGRSYYIPTTNELLDSFLNQPPYKIIGGKTGFLPAAGYCFGALISENNAHQIVVVVLGSDSKHGRFQDAKALAAWTYKVYNWPDELALSERVFGL